MILKLDKYIFYNILKFLNKEIIVLSNIKIIYELFMNNLYFQNFIKKRLINKYPKLNFKLINKYNKNYFDLFKKIENYNNCFYCNNNINLNTKVINIISYPNNNIKLIKTHIDCFYKLCKIVNNRVIKKNKIFFLNILYCPLTGKKTICFTSNNL